MPRADMALSIRSGPAAPRALRSICTRSSLAGRRGCSTPGPPSLMDLLAGGRSRPYGRCPAPWPFTTPPPWLTITAMTAELVIPPELAVLVEEQAVAAGYASALDYLCALVTGDRRSYFPPLETSLMKKDRDGLRSKPRELMTSVDRGMASDSSGRGGAKIGSTPRVVNAELIAALRRFEGLAPADLKFDRDQANER